MSQRETEAHTHSPQQNVLVWIGLAVWALKRKSIMRSICLGHFPGQVSLQAWPLHPTCSDAISQSPESSLFCTQQCCSFAEMDHINTCAPTPPGWNCMVLLMTPLILCPAAAQPKWMACSSTVIFHTAILGYSLRSPVPDIDYCSCRHKYHRSPSQSMNSLWFPRLPSGGSHQASTGLIKILVRQ